MKDIKDNFNLITIGSIIIDLLIIILGIFFITNPSVGLAGALMLIGILLFICGISSIIKYIINPRRFFRFELGFGIISIIAGTFAIFKPIAVETLITIIIAIWLIVSSVVKLIMALELKKIKEDTWIFDLTVAILVIALGILILVNPFKGNMLLSVYIGVMMSMYAAMDIIEQFFIRKRAKAIMQLFEK